MTKTSAVKNTKAKAPKKAVAAKTQAVKLKTSAEKGISKTSPLSAPVFDIAGKSQGFVELPKEIFGKSANENLLAQAIRVYKENSYKRTAHTKTRAEVRGGGIKPWRQKGTGRARAGSIRSPLWIGGGTVFGPRNRIPSSILPQKMKKQALYLALSKKQSEKNIKVLSNLEKLEPKTKPTAILLSKINAEGKTMLVLNKMNKNVLLAARNIPGVSVETRENLNAYKVLNFKNILLEKESIQQFK